MTKTALITSSAKRVGKHLAETLAKKGYNIAISYNNSKIEALELKEYLTANFKIEVAIYHCDLSDIENTKALADSVIEKFGSSWSVLINQSFLMTLKVRLITTSMFICFQRWFLLGDL